MADGIILDATAVGQVITYVAPGYLAYIGYRLRYPGPGRPAGEVLVIAVAASLPLVALADFLPFSHRPQSLGYVLILLGGALILGYFAALARGRPNTKTLLGWMGYRTQPETSIYAQTLYHMSDEATVLVELKDGRRVSGCPRNGPQSKDDGINELYLTYPEAPDENGVSQPIPAAAGVIVALSEVSHIVLSEDPTSAPALTAEANPGDAGSEHGQHALAPEGG